MSLKYEPDSEPLQISLPCCLTKTHFAVKMHLEEESQYKKGGYNSFYGGHGFSRGGATTGDENVASLQLEMNLCRKGV